MLQYKVGFWVLNAKFFKIFYGNALTQQQKVKEKQRPNILLSLHACTAQNGSKLCQKAIKDKLSTFFEATLLIVTQFHCLRACGQWHCWASESCYKKS